MIAVVDYGLGNLASVKNALTKLRIENQVTSNANVIQSAKSVILPGVGAAGAGMKNLKERNLVEVVSKQISKGKPLLGICLGMQLLFSFSEEDKVACLNQIEGKVKKFNRSLKVPQIGWNQVKKKEHSKLLSGIEDKSYFYFVNSYYCEPTDKIVGAGQTEYGGEFCSVVERNNIFGVQFHPEKSSDEGLKLLKNFSQIK